MKSPNFISERTLLILYGDNLKLPAINNEITQEEWSKKLNSSFSADWRIVKEIPINYTSSIDFQQYKFSYDEKRFNPFQLNNNFSQALSLLEECHRLKDLYKDIEVKILDQQAMFEVNDLLDELEKDENLIFKNKLYSFSNSKSVTTKEENWQIIHKANEADILTGEKEELELEILKRKNDLRKKQINDLRVAIDDPQSPRNKSIECSRYKAIYAHRFNELVMHIEVIKHGLLIIKGIKPNKLGYSTANVIRAIEEYRNTVNSINSIVAGSFRNNTPSNSESFEPESDIRNYLWEVSIILQSESVKSQNFIHRVSIKPQIIVQSDWKRMINQRDLRFNVKDSDLFNSEKLIGISVEFVLKAIKTESLIVKVYDINYSFESLKNTAFQISVSPPRQLMGDNDKYPFSKQVSIKFSSSPSILGQSTSLLNGNGPMFYGTNLIENYTPYGDWNISFKEEPTITELSDKIEDVYLFLHLKS